MFESSRVLLQRVVATRVSKGKAFSQAAHHVRDGVYREKNFKEAFLGDKGAYPVMSIIVIGIVASVSFGVFYMSTSPDVKLVPGGSRSKMFRANLADEYIKEDVDMCK